MVSSVVLHDYIVLIYFYSDLQHSIVSFASRNPPFYLLGFYRDFCIIPISAFTPLLVNNKLAAGRL